jgi:hypothetical protein
MRYYRITAPVYDDYGKSQKRTWRVPAIEDYTTSAVDGGYQTMEMERAWVWGAQD